MVSQLQQDDLRALFLAACRAELNALKPGNVHIHAGGHGMEMAQFEASAQAAAPWITDARLRVGERIVRALEATLAAAGCNTNLGILLLCSPLAAAAQDSGAGDLRERLARVLGGLDEADAAAVFEAIRHANPGGLGTAPDQDVANPPTMGLTEAMALAADRDRIARAYVTDFEEVFEFGLPELALARAHASDPALAVTTLHMSYLAARPDSHIARKFGAAVAQAVCADARRRETLWRPAARSDTFDALLEFDSELKTLQLNPGTTADLVVATLFADAISTRAGLSSLA